MLMIDSIIPSRPLAIVRTLSVQSSGGAEQRGAVAIKGQQELEHMDADLHHEDLDVLFRHNARFASGGSFVPVPFRTPNGTSAENTRVSFIAFGSSHRLAESMAPTTSVGLCTMA